MSAYNTYVYSTSKLAHWWLGVLLGIVEGALIAWGRHGHQQPRMIVVKAVLRYLLGKDCFVTVVEDYDSGEIFVHVRNFEQMKRLCSVSMFVGGGYHVHTC
jgi:hypothetical protein